ncbi:MAG: amino acid permease, partial [Candidatus Aminicenantes bacterium]|nr:amino acid permease [Candidatus Aminicenantes bacterium]
AYVGSEVKNPSKNMPRSLLLGTGAVILLYFLLNVFYLYAIPPQEMAGVISVGGLAAGNLFGPGFENVVSILIAVALFSSLSAFIILGPRGYCSMARDGCFFKFAAEVHPRFRVPSKAILLQGFMAVLIAVSGSFDQILTYMGFALGIFPILAVIGLFKLRRDKKSAVKLPGFPVTAAVYVLAGVAILCLGFLQRPVPSSIALLTAALGVPAFYLFKNRSRLPLSDQ